MKEKTTPDSRNTPSTTNLEEEEIVDDLGNDGNTSMPEQVNRPNPWKKKRKKKKKICYMYSAVWTPSGPSGVSYHNIFIRRNNCNTDF